MSVYATELIEDIYREADVDIIFFQQLLGYVSARQIEMFEEVSYGKLPKQRMIDAIKLADFLVSGGDFYVQRGHRHPDGSFSYIRFENGMPEFEAFVWQQFADEGIDDVNLELTTSFVKILPGERPPIVPTDIIALVSGYRTGEP